MLQLADLGRTLIGLGVVLLLMTVAFWLLRRVGPQGIGLRGDGARRLRLVESLPLDPRNRLVLVRHDKREHLLMVSAAGGVTVLHAPDGARVDRAGTEGAGVGAPAGGSRA